MSGLGAGVAVLARVALKLWLFKLFCGRIIGLFLRRYDDRDILIINLFHLVGVGITGVSARSLAFFVKVSLRLVYLVGKLVDVVALIDYATVHDQPVFFIGHGLGIVPGMGALSSLDLDAFRISDVKTAAGMIFYLFMDGLCLGLQSLFVLQLFLELDQRRAVLFLLVDALAFGKDAVNTGIDLFQDFLTPFRSPSLIDRGAGSELAPIYEEGVALNQIKLDTHLGALFKDVFNPDNSQ